MFKIFYIVFIYFGLDGKFEELFVGFMKEINMVNVKSYNDFIVYFDLF